MDTENSRSVIRERKNISASEIAEYYFCSVAWYMDKNGYPRETSSNKRLMTGYVSHQALGKSIQSSDRMIKWLAIGVLLLIAFLVAVLV